MSQPVHIRRGSEAFRGTDIAQVVGWAREGRVVATDFILDPTSGSWQLASEHPEVGPALAPAQTPVAKSKLGRNIGCALLLAFGIAVFWGAATIVGNTSETERTLKALKASRPQPFRPEVGQEARLAVPSGLIVVCRTKADYKEYIRLAVAKDMLGIANLMLEGHGFAAQPGTKVLVIDVGFEIREVRLLEGQFFGRSGWVNSDRLAAP